MYIRKYICMGIITVKISDEVEKALRRKAARLYGAKKGSLSRAVEEALKSWISPEELKKKEVIYKAYRGEELVAEASTLEELAAKLRRTGEPIRGLRIVREPEPPRERRLGLRARRVTA